MRKIPALVLAIFVAGCVVAPPRYTESDLAQATRFSDVQSLYAAIEAEIAADPSSPNVSEYRQMLSRLGSRLASLRTIEVREEIDGRRLTSGAAPLTVLTWAEQSIVPMQKWDAGVWRMVSSELADDRSRTESELATSRQRLDRLTVENNPVLYVEMLESIAALSGSEADRGRYLQGQDEAYASLMSQARRALEMRDYQAAVHRIEQAREIRGGDPQADSLKERASAGLMAARLSAALEAGDISRAEESFEQIRQRQWSAAARVEIATPIELLGGYYQATLQDMLSTRRYERAYRSLINLRELGQWIDQDYGRLRMESQFAELMYELAASAGAQGLPGTEYGFLLLLEEFDPNFVALDRLKREVGERLMASAVQWVSTPAIRGDAQTQNVGARIASAVAAYLLKNIPTDVRIVEREHLEEIQRERDMEQLHDDRRRSTGLRAADLLIQGSVLEVRVDHEDRSGRRTVRAVTGRRQVSNPAYEAYRAERGRRSDDANAPPQTIEEEIVEDISINVSVHRKSGSVAVSYRLVEAGSASVLRTNSVTRKRDFIDEASEGVQLGEFSQPFKLADLPSDGEIINELVEEVALAIGEDLMEVLASPESRYLENCERFSSEGNFVAAAEECAKAVILIESKQPEHSPAHDRLRHMTLNSGLRPD